MPVALLDFPNHPNVGDSAIWCGEARWLRDNGNVRRYICDVDSYSPDALRTCCSTGPILLHGGGNFGDLWPRYQRLRERVIREFPDRPVIQLPQTIHFADPAALAASARIFNAHPDFTLLVRDTRSLHIAASTFSGRVALCPDMAFCLTLRRSAKPTHDEVSLKRTDQESSGTTWAAAETNALVLDWLDEPRGIRHTGSKLFTKAMLRYPNRLAPAVPYLADSLARWRLARGVRLLSRGRHVLTDRLHAHILCVLLGIPHRVIDNSYGKLSAFIDTWTQGTCDVSW